MSKDATLVLIVSVMGAAQVADPAVPKELVGAWKLDSTSFNGAVPAKSDAVVWLVILENGDFVVKAPKDLYGGTVAVDPKASPMAIDFRVTLRAAAGKPLTNLGIYELKDGVLTTAKAPEGKDRPTSIKPQVGSVVQSYKCTDQ